MKKLLLSAVVAAFISLSATAQDPMGAGINGSPTQKGNWLVEINTGFGNNSILGIPASHPANTGIGFFSTDGVSVFSIGGEGGYFIEDNLALKLGLGYGNTDFEDTLEFTTLSYKLGAKYYIDGKYPVQADITGASFGGDLDAEENPFWLGLQSGYAYFVHHNVAIEPGIRYNISLNDDFDDENVFEFRVGASIFF